MTKPEEKTSDKLCQDLKTVTVSSGQKDETGKGCVAGNGSSQETLTGTTSHSEPETDMKKIEGENVENNDKEKRQNDVQDLKIQNTDGQPCSNVDTHSEKRPIPRHVWSIATMSSFTMTTNTPELSSHRLRKSSETCTSDSYSAISSDTCHEASTSNSSDLKNVGEQSDIQDSNQTPEPLRISTSSENVIYFSKCIVDSVLAEAIASLTLSATNMTSSEETVDNSTIQVDKNIQHQIVDASSEESEVLEDAIPQYNYQFLYSQLTDGKVNIL